MYKLLSSSRLHTYYIYTILQKAYFKYRMKRIKRKKKDGIDPISTAFDKMKVFILLLIYLVVLSTSAILNCQSPHIFFNFRGLRILPYG